jgi:hypothetical protein
LKRAIKTPVDHLPQGGFGLRLDVVKPAHDEEHRIEISCSFPAPGIGA